MADRGIWSRAFGAGAANDRAFAQRREWEELTELADRRGVQWSDLTQEGYRVAGDRTVGGMKVRYDWRWRIDELRRRIEVAGDPGAA